MSNTPEATTLDVRAFGEATLQILIDPYGLGDPEVNMAISHALGAASVALSAHEARKLAAALNAAARALDTQLA